jgi:hypothetical protein
LRALDGVCVDLQHCSGGAKVPSNKQLSELSAEAHPVLGVQEVAGSNPVVPISKALPIRSL